VAAKKLEPETKITFGFGREMFLTSLKYGMSVAGHQIFANVQLLYERMLITRLAGPDMMTNYVVPMTMSVYILVFMSSLTLNLMPYTSELFAKNRIDELEIIYRRLTKFVCTIVVFICVALAVGSFSLLSNWIDAPFAEASYKVFVFQLATFGLLACMSISWQFIEGFGLPVYNTASGLSWLLISIPLMLILTKSYGIWGTALARLLAELTIPISIMLVEKKIFGKILGDLWLKVIGILSVAAIIAGLAENYLLNTFSTNWLSLLFSIFIAGLIYVLIVWFSNLFSSDEKIWMRNQLKKVFV
jgi:O-antigen/teichoic acid export membrane protein